jgi:hypothetical protein
MFLYQSKNISSLGKKMKHFIMKNKNPYKNPNLLLTINNIILFIDPHGTKHTEALGKIDGYKKIFGDENENPKVFYKDKFEIKSYFRFYNKDLMPFQEYKAYLIKSVKGLENISNN